MSVIQGKLISLIITERFGEIIEKVSSYLFKNQNCPLFYIVRNTALPISKVKEALCILIKHGLVTFISNKKANLSNYSLVASNVLLMLRYQKYVSLIKTRLGIESELLIEEVLQRGYWSGSNLILKVSERMSKDAATPPSLTQIKDKFIYLITAKYLKKVSYAQQEIKQENGTREDPNTLPKIDINQLIQYKSDSSIELPDSHIYWRVNFERFHEDMRDDVLVNAFRNKFDENVAEIMKYFLQQMYVRTESCAEISNLIPTIEVKNIFKKQAPLSNSLKYLDQYLSIIEQDSSKIMRKAGEASGGSYQIYLKEAFIQFSWELIEQVIFHKYDVKAARIFRLIKLKPYISPDQIQNLAMIPAKDARKIISQLFENNYLNIQEIRKGGGAQGKDFTLLYIDFSNVIRSQIETCYKSLYNLMYRRSHERKQNYRIIDKKQRVNTIISGMKETATPEQLADIEDLITEPERKILQNIETVFNKLSTVEIEIDDTLFILDMCMLYLGKKI